VKDQNELQAMNKDPPIHTRVRVHFLLSTEMKGRNDVLDWDKLPMYDQVDLPQLAFVARETLVELDSLNYFVHGFHKWFTWIKSQKLIDEHILGISSIALVGMYKDDLSNVTLGVNHFGNLSK
jgi:hypothetical protein